MKKTIGIVLLTITCLSLYSQVNECPTFSAESVYKISDFQYQKTITLDEESLGVKIADPGDSRYCHYVDCSNEYWRIKKAQQGGSNGECLYIIESYSHPSKRLSSRSQAVETEDGTTSYGSNIVVEDDKIKWQIIKKKTYYEISPYQVRDTKLHIHKAPNSKLILGQQRENMIDNNSYRFKIEKNTLFQLANIADRPNTGVYVSQNKYELESLRKSGYLIDQSKGTANRLQLWERGTDSTCSVPQCANQKWQLVQLDFGKFIIKSHYQGHDSDRSNGSDVRLHRYRAEGNQIHVSDLNGSKSTYDKWKIHCYNNNSTVGKYCTIISQDDMSKVITLSDHWYDTQKKSVSDNKRKIVLDDFNNENDQAWYLNKL